MKTRSRTQAALGAALCLTLLACHKAPTAQSAAGSPPGIESAPTDARKGPARAAPAAPPLHPAAPSPAPVMAAAPAPEEAPPTAVPSVPAAPSRAGAAKRTPPPRLPLESSSSAVSSLVALTSPQERGESSQAEKMHTPDDDDDALAKALAGLHQGNLAYITPEKMKTSETAHIVARIGGDKVSAQALENGMTPQAGEKVTLAATPVTTKMKMTLKSADFDITALSSEEQLVAGNSPTSWEWDITPKHSGKLRLHLAAVVELNNIAKDFTVIDRDIAVQVDPLEATSQFIATNWQWLIATLATLSGGAWKLLHSRKQAAGGAPQSS